MKSLIDALRGARHVLALTGAGISADSGLPTYRGVGGLYDDGPTEDDIPIETALSGGMFRRRPDLTWKYIAQIESACRGARPNIAHRALAALEERTRVTVLTQNVDGLHLDAGSSDVIEIHGNLRHLFCLTCSWSETVSDYGALDVPPSCPACGGQIRPEVVLFDEALPQQAIARLEAALADAPDVVLSIGTTSVFPYIAAPAVHAPRWGGVSFEINPGQTAISHRIANRIPLGAADTFRVVADALGLRLAE